MLGEGAVPDEARRRPGQGIRLVAAHAVGITARKIGERSLQVIVGQGRRAPLMPVGAEDPGAVGVVQQHEIAGQLVLIGCDSPAEHAQGRVAVALRHVAQHLVESAIFLDDVNDVPDAAGLADPLGDGPRRLAGPRRLRATRRSAAGGDCSTRFARGAASRPSAARGPATAIPGVCANCSPTCPARLRRQSRPARPAAP